MQDSPRSFPGLAIATVATAALLAAATSAQTLRYSVSIITPPNAKTDNLPPDIDNRGRFAGTTANNPGDGESFLRTRTGEFVELQQLAGATFSAIVSIGQNGSVVGASGPSIFTARAVMWDSAGKTTALGAFPGDTFSLANDASFNGKVIGASGSENYVKTRAFVWHEGVMRHVPIPNYPYASLEAFGAAGSMVGIAWVTDANVDGQGFVIGPRGKVKMVGVLPGGHISQLYDVNLFGTAVGFADDGTGPPKAVLYLRGKLQSLGTLPGDFFAQLLAINNSGTAVGQSFGPAGPRGVISRAGGALVDLNTLLDPATSSAILIIGGGGINDRGEIAAGAVDFSQSPPVLTYAKLTPIWR